MLNRACIEIVMTFILVIGIGYLFIYCYYYHFTSIIIIKGSKKVYILAQGFSNSTGS